MTTPPSNPWPPPPPGPGQQPPSWGQQPPWGPPPQRGGNRAKWILGGIALVVVIGLTVVATLLVTKEDAGVTANTQTATAAPTSPPSVDPSEFASADDDGPIEVITDEPTCAAWTPIGDTLAQKAAQGWNDHDPSIPASDWTPAQRALYEDIADAMRSAADETSALVKLTPHRVVRELYEQSIAYWRAFADKVDTYTPADNTLAQVAAGLSNAVMWICSAIRYGSAASRAPLVAPATGPRDVAPLQDPARPTRFLSSRPSICAEWSAQLNAFDLATAEWSQTDAGLPAADWGPEQQQIYVEMSTVMQENANTLQTLGMRSDSPVLYDFAVLAAQYRRACVQSFATYFPADAYLANTAAEIVAATNQACLAAS